MHNGRKDFYCPFSECSRRLGGGKEPFTRREFLNSHLRLVHKVQPASPSGTAVESRSRLGSDDSEDREQLSVRRYLKKYDHLKRKVKRLEDEVEILKAFLREEGFM
jgi:hypothetical protein